MLVLLCAKRMSKHASLLKIHFVMFKEYVVKLNEVLLFVNENEQLMLNKTKLIFK